MTGPAIRLSLLLLLAACGPRVERLPAPEGGYATLVPNSAVAVTTARGARVTLPAGTSLTADASIGGQRAYCGPVYVDGVSARLCLVERGENCFSADGTGPVACFPRGTFAREWPRQESGDAVAAEMGLGYND